MRRPKDLLVALVLVLCATAIAATPASAAPPTVTMGSVSNVSYTTAEVSGEVDPEGEFTEWFFQVSKDGGANWDSTNLGGQIEPGTDPVAVGGTVQGLSPDTAYLVRLTAFNYTEFNFISSPEPSPEITTLEVEPPTVLSVGDATRIGYTTAQVAGEVERPVNDDPAFNVNCQVEYVTNADFEASGFANAQPAGCAQNPIETSGIGVPVDAALKGLSRGTTYHYRLTATNLGGSDTLVATNTFTTDDAVQAQTLAAGELTPASAVLAGRVNPSNGPVAYQFEWGTSESYGNVAPASPEPLGVADETFHVVTAPIGGLSPESVYHFRIVAENTTTNEKAFGLDRTLETLAPAVPPGSCPNEDSRVGFSAELPDCRVYEFASPGLNGAAISEFNALSSDDGEKLLFETIDAPLDAESGFSVVNDAVATRGPDGWNPVKSLSPPQPGVERQFFCQFRSAVTRDFTGRIVVSNVPIAGPGSPPGMGIYMQKGSEPWTPVSTTNSPVIIPGYSVCSWPVELEQVSPTPDFSHVLFETVVKQLPESPTDANLYERVDGEVRLVSILPDDEPAPAGGKRPKRLLQPISEDGNSIVFEDKGDGRIYLRTDGEESVEVTASQKASPDPGPLLCPTDPGSGNFFCPAGITADGSKVLFISRSALTDDADIGDSTGFESRVGELYSYDVASGDLTDLSATDDPESTFGGAVSRVLAVTHDGSFLYFLAYGKLAPGAVAGEGNLYVLHDGEIEFIAPAGPPSNPDVGSMQISPDGRHAAFESSGRITPYDNAGKIEVYEYTDEGGVVCASCRPDGAQPEGDSKLPKAGAYGLMDPPHGISDDGSRVFFNSADAIVPEDINGEDGCIQISQFPAPQGPFACNDVYMYEDGEPQLISTGTSDYPAVLMDASASGDDVFFYAHEELAPRGQGSVSALYTARVNADAPPPTPQPICNGNGCKGQGTKAPNVSSAGSGQLEAPQLLAGPQAKMGQGRRLSVRLTAPDAGQLTVNGKGLKKAQKQIGKAGPVTISLVLTGGANRTRLEKGRFQTKAQVLFKSSSGALSRAEVKLEFKSSAKKGGN